MAKKVIIIDLQYLLKLVHKLKGQKLHSTKMMDFSNGVKFCVPIAKIKEKQQCLKVNDTIYLIASVITLRLI